MPGFLVPDWFVPDLPNDQDMNIASIVWGMSMAVLFFNCAKAFRQTLSSIERKKALTAYVSLLWAEIISSFLLSVMCWFYLRGSLEPSFQFYFFIIVWWSTQVQCLIQIIINRVGLLMLVRSNATKLKWICFLILFSINISVFCIWVPARLQITEQYVHLNEIWDRCEKVIFAIMDASLNFYFIYIVKKRLISNGLQKYTRLYQMNLGLSCLSILLDILLICMMSLPNSFVYIQFHPLVYLLKLHIEMNMADLIGKVVKAGAHQGRDDGESRTRSHGQTTTTGARAGAHVSRFGHSSHHRTHIELEEEDEFELKERENLEGIKKTVVTEIVRSGPDGRAELDLDDDDDGQSAHHDRAISEASSTKYLHERKLSV